METLIDKDEMPGLSAITDMQWLKDKYERLHGVHIQDKALIVSSQLSARYIIGRHLSDKAIDLVDEACASIRAFFRLLFLHVEKELGDLRDKLEPLTMTYKNEKKIIDEMQRLKHKRDELTFALREAERQYDLHRAVDLRYEAIKEVGSAISKLEESCKENVMLTETIRLEDIAEVVSRWIRIPVTKLD
ncbi:hypothetical protein AALP_AA1G204400 [Arabis alpina]|uniref:ClpA/ClpB AAA lid domain-containing protein n=1 Tax=Arabis alpina TaxID=50452 RepID=A0A087HPG6_ARAAL|nr:hypothetical protein AALP_AA1G204400 [Arabis alpina]